MYILQTGRRDFINREGRLKYRILFTSSVIIIFMAAITAVSLSSFGSTDNKDSEIQQNLAALLEEAKPYGVFAKNIVINNDFESNFAADTLVVDGTRDIGNSAGTKTNAAGNIYVKKFISGILQLRSADTIYSGTPFEKQGDKIVFEDGEGTISLSNYPKATVSYLPYYLNIQQIIKRVQNNVSSYTSVPEDSKDAVIDLRDGNNCKIDISNCREKISVVHISMAQYNKMQIGGMKIKKNEDQILIIDITGDYSGFQLCRYFVNGVSSSLDRTDIADTVIFNLNDYTGNLYLSEVSGIIVAPGADVCVNGTSRGRVIANNFSNPSGEWHFLAKDLQNTIPPTQEQTESVSETQTETQTESVSVPETESQTESVGETETETQTESVSVPETESQTESQTESASDPKTETQTESNWKKSEILLYEEASYEETSESPDKDEPIKTGDKTHIGLLLVAVSSGLLITIMFYNMRKKSK